MKILLSQVQWLEYQSFYFHLFTCIVCENVFQFLVRTCANTNILYNTRTHLFVSYNTNNSI